MGVVHCAVPRFLEFELYRRLAEPIVGRTITRVVAPDAWYLKGGLDAATVRRVAWGRTIGGLRRIGKLLLVDLADGPTLGLRFGMTGVLHVDGRRGVDDLGTAAAASTRPRDRFALMFVGGGDLRMQDARRLGGWPHRRGAAGPRRAQRHTRCPAHAAGRVEPRRSRRGSWTSPASRGWGTCSPTRCCGVRGSTRRARRGRCRPPSCAGSTATCA
ncbi:MAG: DNA-formamidopyrimidine glycosylase family protein [Paludibaculum sp.]